MLKHMPPVPPANRCEIDTGGNRQSLPNDAVKRSEPQNIGEQGKQPTSARIQPTRAILTAVE
jgi:hypothetical protein